MRLAMNSTLLVNRFVALAAVVLLSTGCQSSGSRWARLNPWSGKADTALAESDPKLPTSVGSPQVQGLAAPATAVASTTTSGSEAPAFVASTPATQATPSLNRPAAAPYRSPATPGMPSAPPTQVAATTAPASKPATGGPYDPNAYPANDPIAAVAANLRQTATTDQQGAAATGDRYANVAAPTFELPDFGAVDTINSTTQAVGDRYASATTAAQQTTDNLKSQVAGLPAKAEQAIAQPAAALAARAQQALPTLPAAPTVALPTAAPTGYPVATAAVAPAGGTLAAANSRVTLASSPGEYRPAGTGSYLGAVNVASRTTEATTPATGTGSAYPTTTPRYR
ncbi:hypothetical protein [Botrimarina hoheduenensis]|uniref:Uncharacterized protein n=1 Tax=Botrimarina hoheduenensis TaxID=2528000 RepID=A0A5C5VVA8_9BACT|nr:hypothetical protein [Botrimarina hoheduenensis]TWT42518.1 hypothetical protein Pla111_28230 [Botrimarina hoheduenensis]